ncbi:hypothetical protein HRbin30_00330 [bacterium HR30]|nr:hypothetical protein HRbin30_00330 [bacterium HR30]
MGELQAERIPPCKHIPPQVREYHTAAPKLGEICFEGDVRQMIGDYRVEEATFANEQVSPLGAPEELIRPTCVAGINNPPPADGYGHPEGHFFLLVRHAEWHELATGQFDALFRLDLAVADFERQRPSAHVAIERAKERGHAVGRTRRPHDFQSALAMRMVDPFQKQER